MFSKIRQKITDILKPGSTLYFPGCITHFILPETEKKYRKILDNFGIEYITIKKQTCCGSPVLNTGYIKDFHKLRDKQIDILDKHKIKKIITNCPSCALMLKTKYKDTIKVYHITEILAKHINKINKTYKDKEITYHDPCNLGKKLAITKEPRMILKALDLKIKELNDSGEDTACCGAGGGLNSNHKHLSDAIAKSILKQVKTKKLVTTCPLCYLHFKKNAHEGLEIIELSQLIK